MDYWGQRVKFTLNCHLALILKIQATDPNMKAFNLTLAVIFILFALLQFNDDPHDVWFWVLVYAGVGLISAFAAFGRYNMWVIVMGIGVVVYQMFRMFPAFSQWISLGTPSIIGEMKASSPHVELVREFLGLMVCLIALIYHYIRYSKLKQRMINNE